MKKLILALLFCQMSLIAQADDYTQLDRDGLNALLEPGEYYIVGSTVNVRSAPNLKAKNLGQVKLHDKVEIVEGMRSIQKIDNIWSDWYKIKYKDGFGYIWGGYIANRALVFDIDKNGTVDYFYCRIRDVVHYMGIIDVPQDIIIYINNKKISTDKLYPSRTIQCDFNRDGDKVLINIVDSDSPEDKVEYNIFEVNKKGEIKFIKRVSEDY